jgi:hypothetical protein
MRGKADSEAIGAKVPANGNWRRVTPSAQALTRPAKLPNYAPRLRSSAPEKVNG